jgi:hypothetical protein
VASPPAAMAMVGWMDLVSSGALETGTRPVRRRSRGGGELEMAMAATKNLFPPLLNSFYHNYKLSIIL